MLGVLDSEDVRLDVTLVCHVLSMKPGIILCGSCRSMLLILLF